MRIISVSLIAMLLSCYSTDLFSQAIKDQSFELKKLLWPTNNDCSNFQDPYDITKVVIEVGESALPMLERASMDHSGNCSDDRYAISMSGISFIGGSKAVNILTDKYNRKRDSDIEAALCFAMASTGKETDIDFLLQSLMRPDSNYDRWNAIEAAAVSLGILKYKEAEQLMRDLLRDDATAGLLADSLKRSIDWIDHPTNVTYEKNGDNYEQIVSAILSCCPLTREFIDKRIQMVRTYHNGAWEKKDLQNQFGMDELEFEPFISSNGNRAVVGVFLQNEQYIYLLRKANFWKVTGMSRLAIYD